MMPQGESAAGTLHLRQEGLSSSSKTSECFSMQRCKVAERSESDDDFTHVGGTLDRSDTYSNNRQ